MIEKVTPGSASISAATGKTFSLSKLFIFEILLIFITTLILQPFLPDYETYRAIYEGGGGHLAVFGRDPGFLLIVQALNPVLNYEQFRFLVLFLGCIIALYSLNNLQNISNKKFGIIVVFSFSPLIFLKFGIQIREGMALFIWLAVLTSIKDGLSALTFMLMAIISCSIHLATAPLWALLFLAFYFNRSPRLSFLIAIALYVIFVYIVSDPSRLDSDQFSGLSKEVIVLSLPHILYWLSYLGFFTIFLLQTYPYNTFNSITNKAIKALFFITQAGIIGLIAGILIQACISGPDILYKGVVSDLSRIAGLILMVTCIILAITGRKLQAIVFGIFVFVDTIRIILVA